MLRAVTLIGTKRNQTTDHSISISKRCDLRLAHQGRDHHRGYTLCTLPICLKSRGGIRSTSWSPTVVPFSRRPPVCKNRGGRFAAVPRSVYDIPLRTKWCFGSQLIQTVGCRAVV